MADGTVKKSKKNDKKNMLFIYNPKAGKAKIKKHLLEIIDVFAYAGYLVTAYPTKYQGDAQNMAKICNKDFYDLIVCSGGDGTLDEVVTGMVQSEEMIPIGYIPAGSTNDFARSLKISNNMVTAAEDIVNGEIFPCDVGRFNEDAFVYIAAFGLFTEVSYATDQEMKNALGHMAYVLEGAKSLSSVKSYHMTIESEEVSVEGEFIYGMISNSMSVGGFKNITGKDVKLDDGKFEVTLFKRPSSLIEMNNIATALLTQKMDSPYIQSFKTSQLKIQSDEAVSWTLDGEFGGEHNNVTVRNEQKVLSIFVKRKEKEKDGKTGVYSK